MRIVRILLLCAILATFIVPNTVVAAEPETTELPSSTESASVTEATIAQESAKSAPEINVPSEVLCSIISLTGVIASALIAKNVSKNTTTKEIEKMRLTWDREDLVSSEEDFSKMASAVAKFMGGLLRTYQREALGEIASVRAKESGDLALALDQLYQAVYDVRPGDIDNCLTNVINEKRKLKSAASSGESK